MLTNCPVTYITPEGRRATAELAYLTPEVLARPNLKVATGARVTRILFDHSEETTRASGVEFTDNSGTKFVAKALKEVVISCVFVEHPSLVSRLTVCAALVPFIRHK